MLEFIAGLGIGTSVGAAIALAIMVYLKNQGYGLRVDEAPATAGRIEALQGEIGGQADELRAIKDVLDKHDVRLDALAQIIVEQDLEKPAKRQEPEPPTGIIDAE